MATSIAHQETSQFSAQSLGIVSDELVATIEEAATKLEHYASDLSNADSLTDCIRTIDQVRGTVNLIQLPGAELLSQEVLAALESVASSSDDKRFLSLQDALTDAFFILPRYLEYTQQTQRVMPILLIPYINAIRVELNKHALAESAFITINTEGDVARYIPQKSGSALTEEELTSLLRRLRHMYQVGLLNVLQDKQPLSGLGIMARALERLQAVAGARTQLWWLAATAINTMRSNRMMLTKERKLLLMSLDRTIKQLLAQGSEGFDEEPSAEQIKALLFIMAIAPNPDESVQQVLAAFELNSLGYNDNDLQREKDALRGPNMNTVASVAAVIQDETRFIKDILENAAQAEDKGLSEYPDLAAHLEKVADILAIVGLASAGNTLKTEIDKILRWHQRGEMASAPDLVDIADTLLYVESTVASLESLNLTDEKLSQANSLAKRDIIATSQFSEARRILLEECQAGLALVKRALTSYTESNFDPGHIKNVTSSLTTVRGAFTMLNLPRAASAVASCSKFIEDLLASGSNQAALQQMLESYADAIIGLEYYLDTLKVGRSGGDETVLTVAEESLAALGYRVGIE